MPTPILTPRRAIYASCIFVTWRLISSVPLTYSLVNKKKYACPAYETTNRKSYRILQIFQAFPEFQRRVRIAARTCTKFSAINKAVRRTR